MCLKSMRSIPDSAPSIKRNVNWGNELGTIPTFGEFVDRKLPWTLSPSRSEEEFGALICGAESALLAWDGPATILKSSDNNHELIYI